MYSLSTCYVYSIYITSIPLIETVFPWCISTQKILMAPNHSHIVLCKEGLFDLQITIDCRWTRMKHYLAVGSNQCVLMVAYVINEIF